MRNKVGRICVSLGAVLILGALALFLYNQRQDQAAEQASVELLTRLVEELETVEDPTVPLEYVGVPTDLLDPSAFEMTEVVIDGYAYIGYLSIPSLELDLPIMSSWDYSKLQISPCRYSGSVLGEDLVLMAHNFRSHFGRISELNEGDRVMFTDMDGITTVYEVVALDVLAPTAVEEMTAGAYDLTLFTCTYGGQNRVSVCCDRVGTE